MKLGDWLSLWKSMPPVVEVPVTVIGRSGRRVAPRRAADAELVRGRPAATLLVEKGLFRGGQHGDVKGTDAIHQLLERPFPGTFAFVTRTDVGKQWHLGPERDMTSLILEGVRRYDEVNARASAFIAALWGQISRPRRGSWSARPRCASTPTACAGS